MYIDTSRGMIHEPVNPINKPLFNFLEKYQPSLDGSRLYDDLIDVYLSQEIDLKEEIEYEPIDRAV
ncbi:hypothetical protein [Bacillus chungangensis]|uniref:YozE SAM-like domain-containing protein n=1 Tax=Bacillus chungangensis TaxID=587633 RepID=A0ABT9WS44_9BACI|nr:hypothetical protein [Bacillus chungangensis]MDQ0176030.1 hypothetical protein [Bacillus chungangensis]